MIGSVLVLEDEKAFDPLSISVLQEALGLLLTTMITVARLALRISMDIQLHMSRAKHSNKSCKESVCIRSSCLIPFLA